MPHETPTTGRFAGFATAPSLVSCYGTLAVIAALGALGVSIALNETLWATAIVTFAALAVMSLALGWRRHRNPWPLSIGTLGALVLVYTMFVTYSRAIELAGFALLILAAVRDWRLSRSPT